MYWLSKTVHPQVKIDLVLLRNNEKDNQIRINKQIIKEIAICGTIHCMYDGGAKPFEKQKNGSWCGPEKKII